MSFDNPNTAAYARAADELRSAAPEDRENILYHVVRAHVSSQLSTMLGRFTQVGFQQGLPDNRARSLVNSAIYDAARELAAKGDRPRGFGR